jgi:hypothetical protein
VTFLLTYLPPHGRVEPREIFSSKYALLAQAVLSRFPRFLTTVTTAVLLIIPLEVGEVVKTHRRLCREISERLFEMCEKSAGEGEDRGEREDRSLPYLSTSLASRSKVTVPSHGHI